MFIHTKKGKEQTGITMTKKSIEETSQGTQKRKCTKLTSERNVRTNVP